MDFEQYIFNEPKPLQPQRPVLKGKTANDHREYADLLEAYDGAMIIFKKKLEGWYERKDAKRNQFKEDLLKELRLGIYPTDKVEKLWDMAWERNDEGLEAVYDYACELAKLVK